MPFSFCFLVCENFYAEVKAAIELQGEDTEIRSFPALCGRPPTTWPELADAVEDSEADIVEIFGSCCLRDLTVPPLEFSRYRINRLEQCMHLLCGPTLVDALQQEGGYLLSSGWLCHWQEHITTWGFDRPTAIAFFGESLNRLVLLDTGTDEDAEKYLADFADFLKLPSRRLPIGLEYLIFVLGKVTADYREKTLSREKKKAERHAADATMTLDLIGTVTRAQSKPQVISAIIELFTMLFAPEQIHFIPVSGKGIHLDQALGLSAEERLQVERFYTRREKRFTLNEDRNGFLLRIGRGEETSALVLITQIAFPEYIEAYLNVALTISEVCALSIEHVRILKKLCATSRLAGKAEVATEVLHNVGNTLNSISVSSEHIREMVQESSSSSLTSIVDLIEEHRHDPGHFFTHDPRGQKLPLYFSRLAEKMNSERTALLNEADRQFRHIRRVNEIIRKQQDVAHESEIKELIDLKEIIEESLEQFQDQLQTRHIAVERDYAFSPVFNGESYKILQVINNLISNAVDAFGGLYLEKKKIFLRLYQVERTSALMDTDSLDANKKITLEITDNGKGMRKEILRQIFEFGFTTKKDGHGFGLHNAANLTAQMRGTLTAESSGPGQGTTFRIELPVTAEGRTE